MRRGYVNIEAKKAGCKAASAGHRTLSGVLGCPYHSKDKTTLMEWSLKGVDVPGVLSRMPSLTGSNALPLNTGGAIKVGTNNVGITTTVNELARVMAQDPGGKVTRFESCTIDRDDYAPYDNELYVRAAEDSELTFVKCRFRANLTMIGNIEVDEGTFFKTIAAESGVSMMRSRFLDEDEPLTLFNSSATDCQFSSRSSIQMAGESELINPTWDMSEESDAHGRIFIHESMGRRGGSVVLNQGGWSVSMFRGESPRQILSGDALDRTNIFTLDSPGTRHSEYGRTRRLLMAGDGEHAMNADDVEVWDTYRALTGNYDEDAEADWSMLEVALRTHGRL